MVTVEAKYGTGKLAQQLIAGPHRMLSDIAISEGGEARGPSPHDYLALALAACTNLTLRLYAEHKQWPLTDVHTRVSLDHQGQRSKFERVIELVGTLDKEQRERLLAIANRCPIHQALTGKIEIATSLAPGAPAAAP